MVDEKKPLDEKQLVARRSEIEKKRLELEKMESDTPKFYLGRPVTIIAETHPAREWTIRFDDTGEMETVQKFSVTDSAEPVVPVTGKAEVLAIKNEKLALENIEKRNKLNPAKKLSPPVEATVTQTVTGKLEPGVTVTKQPTPVADKAWFKK